MQCGPSHRRRTRSCRRAQLRVPLWPSALALAAPFLVMVFLKTCAKPCPLPPKPNPPPRHVGQHTHTHTHTRTHTHTHTHTVYLWQHECQLGPICRSLHKIKQKGLDPLMHRQAWEEQQHPAQTMKPGMALSEGDIRPASACMLHWPRVVAKTGLLHN